MTDEIPDAAPGAEDDHADAADNPAGRPDGTEGAADTEDGGLRATLRERRESLEQIRRELAEDPETAAEYDNALADANASLKRLYDSMDWSKRFTRLTSPPPIASSKTILDSLSDHLRKSGVLDSALGQSKLLRDHSILTAGAFRALGGAEAFAPALSRLSDLHTGIAAASGLTGIAEALRTQVVPPGIGRQGLASTLHVSPGLSNALSKNLTALSASGVFAARVSAFDNLDAGLNRLLKGLSPLEPGQFKRLIERFQPRNLRDADIDFLKALEMMSTDGIPLCLVPDAETVELLVAAEDRATRRRILVDRSKAIFTSCEEVIALCVASGLPEQGMLLRKAIAAYDDHPEAAQTLATVVLDHLVNRALDGLHKQGVVPSREKANEAKSAKVGGKFIDDYLEHRAAFFFHPLPVVHTRTADIQDPDMFYRHSTTHTPSSSQLIPANAVQAVMLAASLLGYHQDLW